MMSELFWVGVVVGVLFAVLVVAAMYDEPESLKTWPAGADTVYLKADGWYWSDETGQEYGPLETRKEAVVAQSKYVECCL